MARKTKEKFPEDSPKRQRFEDWKNTKWVLNNLDEEQLAHMDATPFDVEKYMDWIAHLVDNGIELKLGWDNYSYCYQATISGAYHGYPNCGYACSARSDDGFVDCVKILWYKFEYLCDGDMSQAFVAAPRNKKRG